MLCKHPAGPTTQVTFNIPVPLKAQTITLVGDFNNWNQTDTPLIKDSDGWSATIDLPAGHRFQYRYLADGHTWLNDWAADSYVPNDMGGDDSVICT